MVNFFAVFLGIVLFLFILSGVRLVREYERVVIFRLGRFHAVKGPGLFWIFPGLDKSNLVGLRTQVIDVPRQEAITLDNVPAIVNAAIFYQVIDPAKAIIRVENYKYAVSQIAQTTLRSVIGSVSLDELLSNRQKVNTEILKHLDVAIHDWGVDCSRVELKDLEVPDNMKRAMAKEAESERERRSRIILAQGELQAAQKLAEASQMMGTSGGIYLRLLQTIQEISTENSSTVILPFPAELTGLAQAFSHSGAPKVIFPKGEPGDRIGPPRTDFSEDKEPAKEPAKELAKE
ncbi:MAG: slipin family protein [Candidatus Kariarchaeaceae archaeon]|jgi:regulator of protease activity HflC (stomatin/prohibitin superfamily)